MIHSVMPPKVADWLMNEGQGENVDDMFPISSGNGGVNPPAGGPGGTNGVSKAPGNNDKRNDNPNEEGKNDENKDDCFELSDEESESGYQTNNCSFSK